MKIRREESKESQSLKLGIVRLGRAAGKVITGHSHTLVIICRTGYQINDIGILVYTLVL